MSRKHGTTLLVLGLLAVLAPLPRANGAGIIPEEVTRVRDPFKKPAIKKSNEKPKSDLEMYAVDSFKLLAVVTGPSHLRAMVRAPNNKFYFVSEGMPIGQRKGVIKKISSKAILVRERIVNILGQEENVETQLVLPEEGKALNTGDSPSESKGGGL